MITTITPSPAINEIYNHIYKCGGRFDQWYVGITNNPQQRLFSDHNVSRTDDSWIFRLVLTTSDARNIERYFLNLGCQGGGGGGTTDSRYVYAYFITQFTIEST